MEREADEDEAEHTLAAVRGVLSLRRHPAGERLAARESGRSSRAARSTALRTQRSDVSGGSIRLTVGHVRRLVPHVPIPRAARGRRLRPQDGIGACPLLRRARSRRGRRRSQAIAGSFGSFAGEARLWRAERGGFEMPLLPTCTSWPSATTWAVRQILNVLRLASHLTGDTEGGTKSQRKTRLRVVVTCRSAAATVSAGPAFAQRGTGFGFGTAGQRAAAQPRLTRQ
jgi:hypothetical protein